jgi:hypothetical protein
MRKGKTVIVAVLLVAVIFSIYWFFLRSPYSSVVVGEMQTATVTVNGVEYVFSKEGNMLGIYPWDESYNPKSVIYSPQVGKTYPWLGINITVIEVHMDRFVLSIRPRD